MRISRELAAPRQLLQRCSFENGRVVGDEVEHIRLEHEKAAVNPSFACLRFLLEVRHAVLIDAQVSEPRWRPNRRYRSEATVGAVESEQRLEVHVGDAVSV